MPPRNNKRKDDKALQQPLQQRNHNQVNPNNELCFEGHRLSWLLHSFRREIELHRHLNETLPEKLWYKLHFAVGINEVTRLLEGMPSRLTAKVDTASNREYDSRPKQVLGHRTKAFAPALQVVLVASDCNPRWLMKHLPDLASSRSVPLIVVKDERKGSLSLGELVKVKTAIAIGVKCKGTGVNQFLQRVLCSDKMELESGHLDA